MSDDPSSQRLYTDKEISIILKRTAELQSESDDRNVLGLSLAELKQVATDVGMDPINVEKAASELDFDLPVDDRIYFFSKNTKIELERVIAGEVMSEQWDEIAAEIRHAFSEVGTTGKLGHSLEWTQKSRKREDQVVVLCQNGQTRIRIFTDVTAAAVEWRPVVIIPPLVIALISLGTAPLPGLLLAFGLLLLARFIYRQMFGDYFQEQENRAKNLMERLEKIIVMGGANPETR